MVECTHACNYPFLIRLRQGWIDRKRENFLYHFLRGLQRPWDSCSGCKTGLPMGRVFIVYPACNPVACKMFCERLATIAAHDVEVIDVAATRTLAWQDQRQIGKCFVIPLRDLPAASDVMGKPVELDAKDRRLKLVEA